jgi:hypothetical protein
MSGTIFAVFMLLLPGMDKPQVQRIPVPSYDDCVKVIERLMVQVKEHDGIEQKVFVGCEISGVKSDPA